MATPVSILVVDNYDSFVYNLVQYLGELGAEVVVRRNDVVTPDDVARSNGVLVSPGPGHPRDAGRSIEVIQRCASEGVAMLGVCLGHQALAEAFGGSIVAAPELLHGRASVVTHDGEGIFRDVANPVVAGRYHSLVVDTPVPPDFVVSATASTIVMGLRHRELALEGVQFHPESILTQDGYRMLANWLESCGAPGAGGHVGELARRADATRAALPQP